MSCEAMAWAMMRRSSLTSAAAVSSQLLSMPSTIITGSTGRNWYLSQANPMPDAPLLKLGTRRSPLALAQAEETRARLCAAHGWPADAIELVPVTASGDKVQDR